MRVATAHAESPIAIRTDLCAIFASLELSRTKWLVTTLSPGSGGKMSKRTVAAGSVGALLALLVEARGKARVHTGVVFPIVAIQEAGLDGFWIHRALEAEGIESRVVDLRRLRCHDDAVGRRRTESTARR